MCKKIFMVLVLAACGACAGGPDAARPGPEPEPRVSISTAPGSMGGLRLYNEASVGVRHVEFPMDSVLLGLAQVYEMLGIPDHGVNPAGTEYGNPSFRGRRIEGKRLSRYIDCGMGVTAIPNADDYQVTLMVLSRVSAADEGGTMVVTTVDATAKPRAVSGNPVHCQSKGTLETRLGDLLLLVLLQVRG